ncbi:MAG: HD domain-containing protein [Holophagaceae bacterium]|nr:HD domain-containing protein [Holophagaceae bacterium]
MEFRGMEGIVIELLSAPELQRLRRITQLGLCHFVFPAAEHSRFSHCLGAAYLAVRFGKQLQEEAKSFCIPELGPGEYEIRDLAVAALCHDLGHGPLSHAWEREIVGVQYAREEWAHSLGLSWSQGDYGKLKWHEMVSQALLSWEDGPLYRRLSKNEHDLPPRIREMLLGRHWVRCLPRLLSSDVDVDRGDFLLRDAHNCGVRYGHYDVDWLISTCTIGFTESGDPVIGFDRRKGYRVVQAFLNARRAMYDTVYTHKTTRCAEGMVGLFLRRLKDLALRSGDLKVSDAFQSVVSLVSGRPCTPKEFLALDDHVIWALIEHLARRDQGDEVLRDLGERLLSRVLFKRVPVDGKKALVFLAQADGRDKVHSVLRRHGIGEPKYYLVEENVEFKMLGDAEPDRGYFVDVDDSGRLAVPIRDTSVGLFDSSDDHDEFRIYVPEDAVADIVALMK